MSRSPAIWGISAQSIYVWRKQDRIDKGVEAGLSRAAHSELSSAKRRIAELETILTGFQLLGDLAPGNHSYIITRGRRAYGATLKESARE